MCGLEDGSQGAIAGLELDYGRPRVALEELAEMRGVCALEAEDGLLLVSHHEQIRMLVIGKRIEERMLQRVSVLVLVG